MLRTMKLSRGSNGRRDLPGAVFGHKETQFLPGSGGKGNGLTRPLPSLQEWSLETGEVGFTTYRPVRTSYQYRQATEFSLTQARKQPKQVSGPRRIAIRKTSGVNWFLICRPQSALSENRIRPWKHVAGVR